MAHLVPTVSRRSGIGSLDVEAMAATKNYFVYILASRRNGTLYVGVTADLRRRVSEHRNVAIDGFARRYGARRLVWFEVHWNSRAAIHREKCIKNGRRSWKLDLIEATNPYRDDLYNRLSQIS